MIMPILIPLFENFDLKELLGPSQRILHVFSDPFPQYVLQDGQYMKWEGTMWINLWEVWKKMCTGSRAGRFFPLKKSAIFLK